MSSILNREAAVAGPIAAADATGRYGVMRVALTGSTQNALVPTDMVGRWMRILAVTHDIDVAFTTVSAGTLVKDQASAFGTGHVSAGFTVLAGSYIDVIVPKYKDGRAVYLNWISASSGGFIVAYCSEAEI